MDIRERSDLQLLRISRGAHDLTQVIDSWSNTSARRIESTQMANELLRGSLELQQSLQMLSRLQEASSRICRHRGREEDEEDYFFMETISKSYGSSFCKLQEPRLTVDFSTNSVEELKQVIIDRLCKTLKSDDEKAFPNSGLKFTGRKINFSSRIKKMKAPNLIAKLMGLEQFPSGGKDCQKIEQVDEMKEQSEQNSLEEIIETMRFKGILKNDYSKRNKVLPIVILKSVNLTSVKISEREKTTLAELILEEKTSNFDQYSKQQMKVNMETKRIVDRKNSINKGKRFVELKEVKAIKAPINTTSVESTMSEKGKLRAKYSIKTYKSIKQNNKDNFFANSRALKSNGREEKSREKSVRDFFTETKTEDQKFEDGKLGSPGTETRSIYRSSSKLITDGLLAQEKKEAIIFVNKDEIKKDHKIVCEVMPRTKQARSNSRLNIQSTMLFKNESTKHPAAQSQNLFKYQLLNSKSFHDYAGDLFGIADAGMPIHIQAKNSGAIEVGGEQLLLDCAKELMAVKSQESELSINQMVHPHQRKRTRFLSFNNLLEEISKEIEELASYNENGDGIIATNSLYIILEKDLNATWDVGLEEADAVAAEVETQIISRLIMEVVMDLVV